MLLGEVLASQPFLPYIRQSDHAIRPPWHHPERRLLDYLLVYIQDGHCRFEVEGVAYTFLPGEFAFIQPGQLLVLEGIGNTVTPFAHLDIFYHPLREASFPTRAGQTDLREYQHLMQPILNEIEGICIPPKLQPKDPAALATVLLKTIECWLDPHPVRQMEAQALLSELVVTILYDHTDVRFQRMQALPSFNWLPSYLSLHLSEPITVEHLATRARLSVSRFREVFKLTFGMPPHQYLLQLRIGHAKELLRNSHYSVEQIAAYCGFADIQHFSKAFKKAVRLTPSAFRRSP